MTHAAVVFNGKTQAFQALRYQFESGSLLQQMKAPQFNERPSNSGANPRVVIQQRVTLAYRNKAKRRGVANYTHIN